MLLRMFSGLALSIILSTPHIAYADGGGSEINCSPTECASWECANYQNVQTLQRLLVDKYGSKLSLDGSYGPQTKAALIKAAEGRGIIGWSKFSKNSVEELFGSTGEDMFDFHNVVCRY